MNKASTQNGRNLDRKKFLFDRSSDLPKVVEIDLVNLRPNPDQPRTNFSEESLAELAQSIEKHGLLQPILIKKDEQADRPEKHIIVAGERRFRAFQRLDRESIPAIRTTGHADELALIENIQRQDLSPMEEAEALLRLMEKYQYSQGDLADSIGKGRKTVNEILKITTLPESIKEECRTFGTPVSKSVLLEIARHEDPEEQIALWEQVKNGEKPTKRKIEAKRKNQENADDPNPEDSTEKVLSTWRGLIEKLRKLDSQTLSDEEHAKLLELRNEVNEIVDAL